MNLTTDNWIMIVISLQNNIERMEKLKNSIDEEYWEHDPKEYSDLVGYWDAEIERAQNALEKAKIIYYQHKDGE